MPITYGNDLSLSPLFAKLGHSLEEIRVRALQNILSKLEHNLVCDADLVQEKHLHIRLLEWFNFATCPMQQQVLALVLRMSKHASAAKIYLNIGAVEFLTQLRMNADQSLHLLIDEILDQLFHLPMTGQHRHANECIYKHPEQDGESLPSQFLEPSDLSLQTNDLTANPPTTSAPLYVSPPEPQVGYFTARPATQEDMKTSMYTTQAAAIPAAVANCFRFSTFPWVVLTPTDRHVLLSTDTSLKSSEVSLVTSACDFLSDVVLQDFPAEVFLQRPIIVKSLLSLLSVAPGTDKRSAAPGTDRHSVALHAVKTLQDLAICLEARIYFYHDAAFYTPKQEFTVSNSSTSSSTSFLSHSLGSSDTRPSIIGRSDTRHRGDGQDGDNSSSSDLQPGGEGDQEEMDVEDIQSLQFMQWTTPQFCVAVLERLLPAMKTSDETLIMHGLELLQQVAVLLHESVIAEALWEDGSVPARELTQKFSGCFEMLGDLLYLHYHGNLSKMVPNSSLGQHRVAFTGIALYVIQLLQTIVPVEKAEEALPGDFRAVLALICQDEILARSFPVLRDTTLLYLEKVDVDGFSTYTDARYMCLSLENTCTFLSELDEMSDENMFSLLTQAETGIQSLPYHVSLQLVEGCVRLASYICKKTSPNPSAVKQGRQLVMTLLAHPMDVVRSHTYTVVLDIVKDALGINQVTQPTSSVSQAVVFLMDTHVLYEVACFGLSDTVEKVQQQADAILVYLLQCQLLVPAARWQQLLEALSPIFPMLQGYAAQDTTVGKCILGLLDTEPHIETGTVPLLERFRGTLRLMFNPDTRVRSEGVGRLAWFLAHETESARKLPSFSELDVTNLTHLLIVDSPKVLVDEERGRSVFQTSDVKKVYDIFTSRTVEENVRKSAAERLGIMLQDADLHPVFNQLGGLDKVLSLLQLGVKRPTQSDGSLKKEVPVSLLPGIVAILRCLIQHSASVRHTLAHESYIYYVLLRGGLLHQTDSDCRQQVAACLCFLLFDEVASLQQWSEESANEHLLDFSLPSFVANRYRLPFKPPLHHTRSPNMGVMPPNPDPLTSGALAEMLRFSWNAAWHGGMDEMIKNSDGDKVAEEKLFSTQLQLSSMDRRVLGAGYIPYVLRQCVYDVENATSHAMVTTAILRLSSHLVACARYLDSSVFQSLGWTDVLTRFLLTVPSSNADEQLLAQILHMISLILSGSSRPSQDLLDWINEMLYHPKSAILGLVARPDSPGEEVTETTLHIRRQLNRRLLKFVHKFVGKFPYKLVERLTSKCVHGNLSRNLLTGINRKDAAHFYNLVSLESTLLCLMHVTSRPGWSVGCPDSDSLSVCLQALHSLLEVVSAFHIGRGGMSMSYMGRGVTRSATLCLRHLACEMATQLRSPDWPRNWLFSRQATPDSVGESGLHWLIPLWTYRDTEVRAAGFGIAVALTTTESGRITMMTQCQHIPGGIWGAAFSVLLDQAECSIVRRQAALLLVNLTSQPMPSGSVETTTNVWQGPVVRNEETQVSLVGLSALLALLHHSQFYPEMMVLLGNYYPQPAVHTVSVAVASVHTTPLGSRTTITTSGSGSLATSSTFTEVSTPAYQRRPSIVGQNGDMSLIQPVTSANVSGQPFGSLTTQSPVGPVAAASSQPLANTVTTATSTPASMLGGAVRDTSTPTSMGEVSYPDYHSVATPCLVSGVCQLLSNIVTLAPQDTLICVNHENLHKVLISMEDSSILNAYLKELQSSPETRQRNLVAFDELLQMHCEVLQLLRLFATQDADIRCQLLGDKAALHNLVQMLAVVYQDDADTAALCHSLWESVFSLFLAILQTDGQVALQEFSPVFVKHWSIIGGRTVSVLQDTKQCHTPLGVTVLQFLAVILTEEARWRMKVTEGHEQDDCSTISLRLDSRSKSDESDIFQLTSGHQLCQVLVKAYDSVALKPHDQFHLLKVTVINAFKALLAVSTSAKMAALEGGVVESICEHVRHLLRKIKLQVLELGLTSGATSKTGAARKKENPVISELIVTFELLRSFMFGQTEVKMAAYESGLGNIVHSLWVWCLLDAPLMSSVLALLSTFTARCPQASSSLVFTSAQSIEVDRPNDALLTATGIKGLYNNNSLLHCLIKLLRKTTQSALLRSGFSLMCTLALSQECRGVLWKCNFLHEFSSLMPKKPKKTALVRVRESVWLDLLVSLSFSTDGQNMILKVDDAVALLLEFGSSSSEHNQKSAVLVVRNLCFNTAGKSKLLATAKLLPFLLQCVEHGSEQVRLVGCSALWALVYNSHKAKVSLKNAHVMSKLQETYNQLINVPDSCWAEKCAQNLHDVLVVLRT